MLTFENDLRQSRKLDFRRKFQVSILTQYTESARSKKAEERVKFKKQAFDRQIMGVENFWRFRANS